MPYPIATHTPDGRPYRLFFLCGHMRSGTHWATALLNLHPDINCHGEGPLGHFRTVVDQLKGIDYLYSYREPFTTVVEEAFHELSRRIVLSLSCVKPDAQWVGDNTTRQLWPYIPGTHHFYILRDGRDVLTSWTFHQLRTGFHIGEPHRSRMARHLARFSENPDYFKQHPEELFSDEAWVRWTASVWRDFYLTGAFVLDQSAKGLMDVRVLPLRYEELLADTQGQRERMYRFLELDPSRAAPISEQSLTAPGFKHDKPNEFYRSGKAGDWKKYATDNFRRWFKEEAGQALIEAGYEHDMNW